MMRVVLILALVVTNATWVYRRLDVEPRGSVESARRALEDLEAREAELEVELEFLRSGETPAPSADVAPSAWAEELRERHALVKQWRGELGLQPGPAGNAVVAELHEALHSDRRGAVLAALDVLANPPNGFEFQRFRARIVELLGAKDEQIRYVAVHALLWKEPGAHEAVVLLELTRDSYAPTRALAGRCLVAHVDGTCEGDYSRAFVRLLKEQGGARALLATNWTRVRRLSSELEDALLSLSPTWHGGVCQRVLRYIDPKTDRMVHFCLGVLTRAYQTEGVAGALRNGVPAEQVPVIRKTLVSLLETRESVPEDVFRLLGQYGTEEDIPVLERIAASRKRESRTRREIEKVVGRLARRR